MRRLIDHIELKKSIVVSNIIGDGKTLEELIDEQPDAQPQWIPCSERMPDPDTWVLVSCDEDVTIMAVTGRGEWYFTNGDFTHGKVDAWMPLPPPYKEGVKEQNLQSTCNQLATDCISRQAAIDEILGQPPELHYPSWYAEQIKRMPAAQPDLSSYSDKLWRAAYERGKAEAQRMRGRWMLDNDGLYVCDQCGEPCAGELMGKPRDRFCKLCGADMREA